MSAVVGVLNPGEMGAVVGHTLVARGHPVLWASGGRSEATTARAQTAGLVDVATVAAMAEQAEIILSVCPPSAAVEVATAVAKTGFSGCYVDANAISPASAHEAAGTVAATGATFVDGGIVGPPPTAPGRTRFFLSGDDVASVTRVAQLFAETPLSAIAVAGGIGAASALKACYASWTKTTAALLLAIRAVARSYGVDDALVDEWARSQPDLLGRWERAVASADAKAWRWVGEMEEHAATFEAAGMPGGFNAAAAEVFDRQVT